MVIELTKEDPNNKSITAIPADNIYAAEPKFGDYLYEEFMDEWKTQLPEVEGYLGIFENLGKMVIPHDEMISELEKLIGRLTPSDTNKILRFLYDNSIIGVKVGKSTQWKYRHTSPTHAFASSDEYRVHPGLKSRLNLRDPYQALSNEADEE
jgi:hypothetical protein